MPKGRYTGLIKEYDGGTPMECYVHPSIDFTRVDEMLAAQRAFILQQVRDRAGSAGVVYPPLHLRNHQQSATSASSLNSAPAEDGAQPSSGTSQDAGGVGGDGATGSGSGASGTSTTSILAANNQSAVADGVPSSSSGLNSAVTRGTNPLAAKILAVPGIVEAGWTLPDIIAALGAETGLGNGGGGSSSAFGTGGGAGYDGALASTISGGTLLVGTTGRTGSGRGGFGYGNGGGAGSLRTELLGAVRKIHEQHFSWPFREPVDTVYVSLCGFLCSRHVEPCEPLGRSHLRRLSLTCLWCPNAVLFSAEAFLTIWKLSRSPSICLPSRNGYGPITTGLARCYTPT
jgi:hypothetical protein